MDAAVQANGGGGLTAASDGQRSTRKTKNKNAKNGSFAAIFCILIFCFSKTGTAHPRLPTARPWLIAMAIASSQGGGVQGLDTYASKI